MQENLHTSKRQSIRESLLFSTRLPDISIPEVKLCASTAGNGTAASCYVDKKRLVSIGQNAHNLANECLFLRFK